MSESGEIGEEFEAFQADVDGGTENGVVSPLKSNKSSSVESPPSIAQGDHRSQSKRGGTEQRSSSSSSPLLDMAQPLPAEEDITICPYCNTNFRKPRVLDCLHSMCEDCVIAQLDGRNDPKRQSQESNPTDCELEELEQSKTMRPTPPGVIRCPICSQESHVGNDVRFVNFMLLDFIRLRASDQGEWKKTDLNNRICRACKGEQQAVANCRHCCSELCKNCVQAHQEMKLFSGHQVVMFSDLGEEAPKKELPLELALCSLHQATYEQFCTNCDEIICKHCVGEHRDHICAPLNDTFYQYCRSKIGDIAGELEKKGDATAQARSAIPERLSELNSVYERCQEKIDHAFQTFTEVLEEVKQQVLLDLDKKRDEQEDYYNNLYHKIDLKLAMMQDALGFTNRLLEQGTKVELCASRKKIYQQLLTLHRSMPNMNTEFDIDFVTFPKAELMKRLESIVGVVQCRVSSVASKDSKGLLEPTNSTANGPISADRQNVKTSFSWGDPSTTANPALNVYTGGQYAFNPALGAASAVASVNQVGGAGAGPGTIGMERRQNRGSCSANGFSSGFSSSDLPSMFSGDSANLPSPPTQMMGQNQPGCNQAELYNLARLNLDGSMPTRGLPQTSSFNSLDSSSAYGVDPFVQQKVWGAAFNNPQPMNAENSLQKSKMFDPRFTEFDPGMVGGFHSTQMGSQNPRSSQCNTPAFETMTNITTFGAEPGRMGSTIEMSLHTMFGSSGVESLNTPQGLSLGLEDELAVADTNNHRCVIVNTSGKFLRQLGSSGTEEGCLYFPRKVVSLVRGHECKYIVLDRGPTQLYNRLQLFSNNGDFLCRLMTTPYHVEQISVMTVNKGSDQLVVIDNKNYVISFSVETVPQIRAIHAFNITGYVHEASDIAVYKGLYYITDYKTHSIVVYTVDGKFMHKFGSNFLTPKSGDILVGDSHGNHFHIVVFNAQGMPQQDYKCLTTKVSRCTGLKITAEGYVITMSRHNSSVLVFNTLYMPSI